MQNLRDQLVQKGLSTKGQKQQVEQDKRRARKQLHHGQAEAQQQAQQRQAYEARLEAQRQADRQRAAEHHALLAAKETCLRIQHIADYWRLAEEPSGTQRWYFVTRDNVMKYLYVSSRLGLQLSTGALAIIERPEEHDEPQYVLLEREAAELVARVDPTYVRFHNTGTNLENEDQ